MFEPPNQAAIEWLDQIAANAGECHEGMKDFDGTHWSMTGPVFGFKYDDANPQPHPSDAYTCTF